MKSYTQSIALLNSMSGVPSADTTGTSLLSQFWNDSVRTFCGINGGKLRFLETTKTIATVASQEAYDVPARIRKVIDLYVTVGTTVYKPTPIFDPAAWSRILSAQLAASDVPMFYYVEGRQIRIQPNPSSTAGTITVRGRLNIRDRNAADATVTVSDVTNGGTAVTVSSGALAAMAGAYIRITKDAAFAANKGDGFWYEIESASPSTSITLVAPYEGTTLSGASASSTVAEMTPIPEAYDMGPIYRTLALYWSIKDPLHPERAKSWWKLYDGGQEAGFSQLPGGLVAQMLETEGETVEGTYISPSVIQDLDPNTPPQRNSITGF